MYDSDSEDSSSGDSDGSGTSEREYAMGHISDTEDEEENNDDEEEKNVVINRNNSKETSVTSSMGNKGQEPLKARVANKQSRTVPVLQGKQLQKYSPLKSKQTVIDTSEKIMYHHKQKEPPLTRREYMETRRKIHKWKDPGLYEPPKEKKRPGRNARDVADVMSAYHKVFTAEQSDIQSDYEGYLSDIEVCDHAPRLKRTQSSESIFLDDDYEQFSQKKLSAFHEQCLHSSKLSSTKQRRLTMKQIRHKHSLNYAVLTLERNRFMATNDISLRHYRATAAEIDKTKRCIRMPAKFEAYNIPKVFSYGDAPLVDIIADVLKDTVDKVVEKENVQVVNQIWLTRETQQARFSRRKKLEALPIKEVSRLPKPEYLCMEMLHLRRVYSEEQLEHEKQLARIQIRQITARFPVDERLQKISREKLMIKRNDAEFEKYWKDVVNRTKQLKNSLKIESLPTNSLQHSLEQELLRVLGRRIACSRNPQIKERIKQNIKSLKAGMEARKPLADIWKPAYARMERRLRKREKIARAAHEKRKKRALRNILFMKNNLKKTNGIYSRNIRLENDSDEEFEIQRMADELHEEASRSVKAKRAKSSAERLRLKERFPEKPSTHRNLFPTSAVEIQKNTSVNGHNKKRDISHREGAADRRNNNRNHPEETESAPEDDPDIGLKRNWIYVKNKDHIEGDEDEMDEFGLGEIDDDLMREESALDMYPEIKTEYMENEFGEIVESPLTKKRNRNEQNKTSGPSLDEYELIEDDIFIGPVAKKLRHVEEEVSADETRSPSVDNNGNSFLISDDEYVDNDYERAFTEIKPTHRTRLKAIDEEYTITLLDILTHPRDPSYQDARNAFRNCESLIQDSGGYKSMLAAKKILKDDYTLLLKDLNNIIWKKGNKVVENPTSGLFKTLAGFFKYSPYKDEWIFNISLDELCDQLSKDQEEQLLALMGMDEKLWETCGAKRLTRRFSQDFSNRSSESRPRSPDSCLRNPTRKLSDLTRMADSEVADINLRNRFRGTPVPPSLPWEAPVEPVDSVFWDRVQVLQRKSHREDIKKWEDLIMKSINEDVNQKLENEKIRPNMVKLRDLSNWIFPTLAVCHVFLTKKPMEDKDISSEWDLSIDHASDTYSETIISLKRAAIYLRGSCEMPENLLNLLEFNGFPQLFKVMTEFFQAFLNCAADVNVVYKRPQKPGMKKRIIKKEELFSWLLIELGKRFEYKGRDVKEEFLISKYLLKNTKYVEQFDHIYVDTDDDDYVADIGEEPDKERAKKLRKTAKMGQREAFEKQRVVRINTIRQWYKNALDRNASIYSKSRGLIVNRQS
ncbi:hypothetical protein CAEBREN_01760 [Caenorhabditis brenneri]|uniref:Uncharacterized protein n=1 Tax=Caenorhabditis brenneri TaxID=135651 RepID=G0N764_CAEBE|nr:hypothetical protein CAEBREN_01760 [Caenorhabditis brenneri]